MFHVLSLPLCTNFLLDFAIVPSLTTKVFCVFPFIIYLPVIMYKDCVGLLSIREIIKTSKTSTLIDDIEQSLINIKYNIDKWQFFIIFYRNYTMISSTP
jgi:hypothetical protein